MTAGTVFQPGDAVRVKLGCRSKKHAGQTGHVEAVGRQIVTKLDNGETCNLNKTDLEPLDAESFESELITAQSDLEPVLRESAPRSPVQEDDNAETTTAGALRLVARVGVVRGGGRSGAPAASEHGSRPRGPALPPRGGHARAVPRPARAQPDGAAAADPPSVEEIAALSLEWNAARGAGDYETADRLRATIR